MRESYDKVTVEDDDLVVRVSYTHTGTLKMLAEDVTGDTVHVVYEEVVEK